MAHRPQESSTETHPVEEIDGRRSFLQLSATGVMCGGLAAGYGTLAAFATRFLYPAAGEATAWQFVAALDQFPLGASQPYVAPNGMQIVIARQAEGNSAEDFIALSSICPHLGCQVHWEAQNQRFFCPCHNGVFDPQGKPVSGPPQKSGQPLGRFPLMVRDNLLYILVPLESVTDGGGSQHA